jgi:hypothetical protein
MSCTVSCDVVTVISASVAVGVLVRDRALAVVVVVLLDVRGALVVAHAQRDRLQERLLHVEHGGVLAERVEDARDLAGARLHKVERLRHRAQVRLVARNLVGHAP